MLSMIGAKDRLRDREALKRGIRVLRVRNRNEEDAEEVLSIIMQRAENYHGRM